MHSRFEEILEANSADTPPEWRPFAKRQPVAPRDAAIMWDRLAYGYQRAADIVEKESCDRDRNDLLLAPIFFLYRHYIELKLKAVWQEYFSRGWLDSAPPKNTQGLVDLWMTIKEASTSHGLFGIDDGFVVRVQKSIELFNSIDDRSTHSRYPEVGGEFHYLDLDLEEFIRSTDDIDTFFFGLGARIDIHSVY
jgi:hypothetical protein